ncbi:MAG: Ig-like domain-containing protein [Burkholderiaceae bacterium]|nr:Ig-like domain-containing protein [Sulfuritalea sp.]MCF8174668.1 Ig-like domain-containing protein [Burkholderiaceae bacterium]
MKQFLKRIRNTGIKAFAARSTLRHPGLARTLLRRALGKSSSAMIGLLLAATLSLGLSPAHAAITYFASTSNPADPGNLDLSTVPVTPPGSMLAGDLAIMIATTREPGKALVMSETGGQTWTTQTTNTATTTQGIFWARFNGTWSADPSVSNSGPGGENATSLIMHVFRPSAGSNIWALDVAQVNGSFAAPGGLFDVTITGVTTLTDGALVLATWLSNDDNTWALQSAGWANAGNAQYRNLDSNDISLTSAYKIMPTAGASGNVTNRQTANGGDPGNTTILAFKEIPTTTLATGVDPAAATIAPGATATDVNVFTLQTGIGTEAVSSVTVNLSTNSGIALLAITNNANAILGSTASPVAGANVIAVAGLTASTTATSFKVRVTPLIHTAMPAPPGAAYTIIAPVTAWAGPNAHAGIDTNINALTIDNLSPTSATAASGIAGYLKNTLNWTTSASADFAPAAGSVIYRWTAASAGAQVPVEGSAPVFGAINGTATVACVVSSAGSTALSRIDGLGGTSGECTTAALTAGQAYTYKVFQKDSNGNYDVGVVLGTFTPHGVVSAATSTVVAAPGSIPADGYTTSTITVTLKDGSGIPVPGKTVSLAKSSGTSIIAPASGVTNASGVITFTVKNGTVEGPITYTATDVTDAIVITQTAQVTFTTPSLCFTDDFNRATLLGTGNWTRTKSGGTTYDAEIVSNRLRLTDSAGGRATAVHLQRLFPGAGNKVVAEFDYFAYNGSGADGVVMTLSDSSVAPVAGAFGGSLGYAQKSNPGSDCTVPGGCPGFAGGWLGIGLDEYGNFSNPTEGRVDGPGFQADSISIRGSGSGLSNYNYHTRALVSPGVDSAGSATPAPGHRYRVTVDHGNGTNALVTVDRDVTGLGTSYTNVIPTYDAKAIVTQAAVPPYWLFSFTGSTGGATNTHEIDNLTVCTAQPLVTPVLDHVRIVHDGAALTCAPETITLKACANAACDALFTGSVTTNLTAVAGATWSLNPVTFSSGQTTVTLSRATTGTVTLGGTVTAPSTMPAVCYNGATSGDCALTYSSNACAFDAVEATKNPSTPIFTKLAGTPFTVDVLALTAGAINTGYTGTVTVDLVDQTGVAPGACGTTSLAVPTSPTSPYTFVGANNGRRSFTFNYPNAARDVRVRMVSGATTACSSDNFAIRPTSFGVTSNANNSGTSGTPTVKAGANFTLDATSLTGYTGTALINSNRIQAHAGAAQTGTIGGSFAAASSGTSWISRGTSFSYSEVGSFRFAPWGVYDDGGFAGVDRSKPTPECFIDNKIGTVLDPANPNVLDGNGKYGCYFGGTVASPWFGRFTPNHFAIAPVSVVPGCGTFTYFGQDGFATAFTLTAQNSGNATTANYVGIGNAASWAKLPLTVWGAAPASAGSPGFGFAVSAWAPSQPAGATIAASTTPPSATNGNTWLAGTTTVTARHLITRPTAPAAPTTTTVSALPVDSDGVTLVAATAIGMPVQRFGRLRLLNAYGSELLQPRVEYRAEYWDGSRWTSNTLDACTVIASGNVAATGLTVNSITPTSAGVGFISFNTVGVGAYDIALNLNSSGDDTSCNVSHPPGSTAANKPWLQGFWSSPANCGGTAAWAQDPNARIKLGSPKAPYIYLRERY